MSKITQYAALTSPQPDDVVPVVDVHDITMASTGTTKKITVSGLLSVTLVAPPSGVAVTDTANISAAITAWVAAGKGVLQFQEGTYVTNGGHLAGGGSPGAGIIQGTGWNTEIQLAAGANAWIFDFGSGGNPQFTPGIRIRDLYLNCNGGNQTGTSGGIYARGSVFGVFDHIWVDQPYTAGIWFYQDGLGNYGHHNRITGSLFTNGYVSGSYGIGVKFDHADENSIDDCTFQDCGTSTYPSTQLYDTSGGRQSITNTAFVTTRTTSAAMFKTDSNPSACMLIGNAFDSNTTGNLVEINGPDCIVEGNNFLSFGNTANNALHLNGANSAAAYNTFTPSGSSGTAILNDAAGCKIAGNTFAGSYVNNAPVVYSGVTVPPLNPVDWGADASGSADATAVIAAVIAALSSAGGGLMDCPPATFKMSSPVNITAANVKIRGAGAQLTVFKMTASFGASGTDRGIFQYLSGPAAFSGCEITDCGFDSSACTDTTVNGPNCVYQNGSVPVRGFTAERLWFNMNSYGQGILLNQVAGSGSQGYGLTFRDITGINGAGTISCYNNGVSSGSLMSDILIDGVYNRCTQASLNDDRVAISGNNGGGTNVVEVRNVSISNVYTEVVSGAGGVVHGVKLDCGAYGYVHECSIRNVFFYGLTSGVTGQNPVLCELGTNGTMQDILIDGVWGYTSGAVIAKLWRSAAAPHITVRNVHLFNLLDTRAIEVYTANSAAGDETILIENCTLHSGTAVSGNTPVGVMLTSGASGQGASGLVRLQGITLAGTFSVGFSDDINESGSTQATAYSNIDVSGCNLGAATTQQVITGSLLAATGASAQFLRTFAV